MPRKFTVEQRRRMLELLENGATHSDIKREFTMKDSRTLEKQLRKAREEEVLHAARADIVKQSLNDHLSEVRSLIETWSLSINAPSLPSLSRYPLSAAEEVEQKRLFEGLRSHLPFTELWKTYDVFKAKWDEYLIICQELHNQIVEDASMKWGLSLLDKDEQRPGLAAYFSWETLDHAFRLAQGDTKGGIPLYETGNMKTGDSQLEFLTCDGRVILYATEIERYAKEHQAMIAQLSQSEKMIAWNGLIGELRELEARIHNILEESLLRRDYILYTCRLCPGQHEFALIRS